MWAHHLFGSLVNLSTRFNRITIFILALALISCGSLALGEDMPFTFQFSESELSFGKFMGYDAVNLNNGSSLSDLGKPSLPFREYRIALPSGMAVQSVEVTAVTEIELSGYYRIFPAQKPLLIGEPLDNMNLMAFDSATYGSAALFPSSPARLIGQTDLAGQSFAIVDVLPLGYSPEDGRLILYTSISIILKGSGGYICGDYLPDNSSESSRRDYEEVLASMAANPEDTRPMTSPFGRSIDAALLPGGVFNHVIITSASMASYWNPLIDWHNKKGVRDTVISTTHIYSNYSGTSDQQKIRNFIIDAYNTWGTNYFLIGGEHASVPFMYRTYIAEYDSVPSDAYYADFDDDWTTEVYVGRVTADVPGLITRFINKLLLYETNPPRTSYILNAALLGMDLDAQTASEQLKDSIDLAWIPSSFNLTKIYDSYASDHKTAFLNALDSGQNLVNHSDHSNYWCLGTGDFNHDLDIVNSDVVALTNTNRLSVIFSVGCFANQMDYNDCIAETFIIGSDMKAGVAFTGNTREGLYYQPDYMSLSLQIDYQWWRGLFTPASTQSRLGRLLGYAKSNCPTSNNAWKYSHWTLNLQGEPEMPVWTSSPDSFTVTHAQTLIVGSSVFPVNVKQYGGSNLSNAYVCLWKNGEVYASGLTNGSGDITFNIAPLTVGAMYVTVTKLNYIPYRGAAQVLLANDPPTCQVPQDTTIYCISDQVCLPVGCSDPNGNLMSGPTIIFGPGEIIDGEWCYSPSATENVTVIIKCTDSAGLYCQASFNVSLHYNNAPMCSQIGDTIISMKTPRLIRIPVFAQDEDGNLLDCFVSNGPGAIVDGNWEYLPSETDTNYVTITCRDSCLLTCQTSFRVVVQFYKCGDANNDGIPNVSDAVYIINYVFAGGNPPVPFEAGDTNCDTGVNVSDAVWLINYVFAGGPVPCINCP